MDPEDQYRLITELLEPGLVLFYVTPPDIDESTPVKFYYFQKGSTGLYFNRLI